MNFDEKMIAVCAAAAWDTVSDVPDAIPGTVDDVEVGGSFVIPVLIPENVETGDGRSFEAGSLTTRSLPLPLLWQTQTGAGHDGSVIVGRIDSIEPMPEGGLGNARGVFDIGPFGQEAERLVRGGFLRGVSADLDMFEGAVEDEEDDDAKSALERIISVAASDGDDEEGDEIVEVKPSSKANMIKADKITVSSARLTAATLVPKPAFQESYIMMADQEPMGEEDLMPATISDGPYEEQTDDAEWGFSALAASAAPVQPPKSWFGNPNLDGPTPLTIADDGRVFGHIAAWQVQHIGLPNAQRPPRSHSRYAYFQTGLLRTAEGTDVNVGQLTLSGGHASLRADAAAAVKHYDDTASAVADVCAGEDGHGIWVAGSLRPGVTPEQVRVLRASAPSGDWRPIEGRLELVAVCQVNVPGFPVARAMVASGHVTALVAAGARFMAELREEPLKSLEDRLQRVEMHTTVMLQREKSEAANRVAALASMRASTLTASAQAARSRLQPELDKREALVASATAARERLQQFKTGGFKVMPDFKEVQHPRDDGGQFREVLGRLDDLLAGVNGADDAKSAVHDAADTQDSGDSATAVQQVQKARARLDDLIGGTTDPGTTDRLKQAQSLLDAAIGGAKDAVGAADTATDVETPAVLDAAISYLLNAIVSQVDPTQAIRNAPGQIKNMLAGKQFSSPEEMASYVKELMRRMISPV